MFLKRVSILNYKNIQEASLELSPGINCLIGHNGVGKTNFLDAVYYMSFCHSAYSATDANTITHDKDMFMIEGVYDHGDGSEDVVYCGMKRGSKKRVKRNGKDYKRLSQHIGFVPLIFVSPRDTIVIDGLSDERRKLMDVVIAQYDHTYIDTLNRYNKALQQRNSLLKMEGEPDPELMELWEQQMALTGEALYEKRDAFVRQLEPLFIRFYQQIAGADEKVGLNYVSHCRRGPLLEVIQRDRFKDRAVGYSLHGVHRDDLEMTLNGFAMKREGSQGQSKTYVLALKLAQFEFLVNTCNGVKPILLLDDIFDKLDSQRVEQIVRIVASEGFGQIFVTDTNRDHLDKILSETACGYKLFHVSNGEIKEKGADNV